LWYVEVIVVPFLGGFGMSIAPYPPDVERRMKELYDSLNEKDRRRYAGVEAAKLGFGGRIYVARLLGCDEKTIRRGLQELDDPPDLPPDRIRKKGRT
jgi:hypothetical protein